MSRNRRPVGATGIHRLLFAQVLIGRHMQERIDQDRSVHVTIVPPDGSDRLDVVRYRRARKWWVEGTLRGEQIREQVTVAQAAEIAACHTQHPWVIYYPHADGGQTLAAAIARSTDRQDGSAAQQ